jgi:hypothetical protein
MYWLWSAWLVLLIASFTEFVSYAVATHQPTLSHVAAEAGAKWPPLLVIYGMLWGGLTVHFWWHWTGQ